MISNRLRLLAAGFLAGTALVAAVRPGAAQETAQPVSYASYYECDPTALARVDSIIRTFWGPLADRQVSAGNASAWGWLGHHSGANWNRVFYFTATDLGRLIDATEGILADGSAANRDLVRETIGACPDHEDYIWQRITGSQSPTEITSRAAMALSTYFTCDPSREARADAIVSTVIGPAMDRAVQSGRMTTWSWMRHDFGGKYRRLLVSDGPDAKSLLAGINSVVDELVAQQREAFEEFGGICSSHQDNLWTTLISKP
ncbi:MAG: hypothetical protein ACREK5_08715 [Gemmatimonadota bacterium]